MVWKLTITQGSISYVEPCEFYFVVSSSKLLPRRMGEDSKTTKTDEAEGALAITSTNSIVQHGERFFASFLEATRIGLPVNTTALFGLDPHSSMKWITSPNLRLGCPQNMTHG